MLDTRPPAEPTDATDSDTPPERSPRLERLALALPALLMLILGLWGLGRDDAMGNDEVVTRWVSSLPLPAIRHVLGHVDAVHGLYYTLMHFWTVFGRSPTTLRVPSLLAMVLAVVVVAVLARRLTASTTAGAAAGLIAAATSSITYYAQTARSYAMVYLVVALATLALVRALDDEEQREQRGERSALRTARPWLVYAGLLVLGGYLNELSLLILGAHLVTVLVARRRWTVMARWSAASALAVVLVLPLIKLSREQSKVLDYLLPPGGHGVWTYFRTAFGGTTAVAVALAVLAAIGLFARISLPASERPPGRVSPESVALPLLVVPAALLMAYSEVATPLYADRYVLFGEIGAAVLAGTGLDRMVRALPAPRRAAGLLAPLVVLIACAAVFLGQLGPQRLQREPQSRQFDFGGPANYLGAHARPGDGVLFFGTFYRRTRLGYPTDFRDTTDLAQAESPARAASFQGRNLPFVTIRTLMLERTRIWVIGRALASISDTQPSVRLQAHVLEQHFVRVEGTQFGKIHATLWRRS